MDERLQERIERAQECERWRLSAWLPYDVCCDMVVDHFQLRHWAALVDSGSSFCSGMVPTAGDIAQFLWFIQPKFDWLTKPDKPFLRRVGKMNTATVLREVTHYLERALYDVPDGDAGEGYAIPLAPFPAHYAHRFCELYGWTLDEVMRAPVARLAQLDRIAKAAAGDKSVYGSKLIALRVMARKGAE